MTDQPFTSAPPRTVFIYVNGILTFPGESDNWNGKAVTWTHLRTPHRAEKVEYYVGPVSRALGQKKRAEKLTKTLRYYEGWEIILAGHSNGCDVILDALRAASWPRLQALHLVSGACDADFDRNGLNVAMGGGRIGRVSVWVAGKDGALKLANTSIGRLLGYGPDGPLGMMGPLHALEPVAIVREPAFGHSDWWAPENLDESLAIITDL